MVRAWLNLLVFQTQASRSNQIKQYQELENCPFKRKCVWGSGVFDAGQIQHRNVQYPASFNTRKIKELEIVSLLTAPILLAKKFFTEGTSLSGDCSKAVLGHLCICFFFLFVFPWGFCCCCCCCSFLSLTPYSISQTALCQSTLYTVLRGVGHIFSLETNSMP